MRRQTYGYLPNHMASLCVTSTKSQVNCLVTEARVRDNLAHVLLYRAYLVAGSTASHSDFRCIAVSSMLPMLSEPCSCWPVAASVGSGH